MAPDACKVLCLVIFFAFITQGYGQCDLKSITVKQSMTKKVIQNKPLWEVRVKNNCACKFQNIKLLCPGFQSVTRVPVLSKDGDVCSIIVNPPGGTIYGHAELVFGYVWDTSFDLTVIGGVPVCG